MNKKLIMQQYLAEAEINQHKIVSLSEYLLVIQPTQALWDEITDIKKKFEGDFKFDDIKVGKPHITLAMFKQYPAAESRIVHALRNNARTISPFKIELKD